MFKIPEFLKSNDIIYHYTKASTAVEYILYSEKLKFSTVLNSIDPIERERFNLGREYIGIDSSGKIFKETEKDAKIVEENIDSLFDQIKIICFCENKIPKSDSIARKKFDKDNYGFLKPRMWDQYGEKYKGVCLAFSKETLLESSQIDYYQKVKYVNYDEIALNFSHININSLLKIGKEKYIENVSKGILNTFFQKHLDYRDEKEFRIIKKSSDEFEFLDISKALKAIIINPSIIDNNFIVDNIVKYADKNKIEVLHLFWDKKGVRMYPQSVIKDIEKNQQVTSVKRK